MLGRYQRHGPKVARVLDPQAGPFRGVVYFNVYGPTTMALNEPLKEPYLSRSVVIIPPEASGKYPDITPQEALPLKERLVAFRARHLDKPLPPVAKPVDGRLGDSLQPFGQMALLIGGEVCKEFPDIALALASERAAERAESKEARLILAVEQVAQESRDGKLPVCKVAEVYNDGLGERAQLSEESVGKWLKGLGFKEGRLSGGGRARMYDPELVGALRKKYGVDFVKSGGSPQPSQPRQPSLLASGQTGDGSVTDRPTVLAGGEDCHSTVTAMEGQNQLQNDSGVTVVTGVTDGVPLPKGTKSQFLQETRPGGPCSACGSNDWWQRTDGGWVCEICHPKPRGFK